VALWFTALYLVFTRYQVTIRRHLGWLLLPLGRNSLFVYISHAFIILGINLLLPASLSAVQNIAINLAVLALIWALAVIKAQTAPQANNAWERFVPAALTISLFTVLIGLHG
jgi:fucose 4-O-acetylase-like acetyltransferase